MLKIPDNQIKADIKKLADCELLTSDGKSVSAKELWGKNPAILVFLRHFACAACRTHAVDVWKNKDQFQAKGAKIHFIGCGAPHFIEAFKQDHGLQGASFYTDPSLESFAAVGFRKGFWIDPGEMHSRGEFIWKAIRHEMKKTQSGSVWQLGGVLAVNTAGKPTYQFTSQAMGDFPPASDSVEIAKAGADKV